MTVALRQEVERQSLASMRNKFIEIGAEVVRHGRDVTVHLAEVAMQNAKQEINRLRQTNVLVDAECLDWNLSLASGRDAHSAE